MPRILRLLYAYQTENYNFLLFNWEKVTFLKLFVRLLGGSWFRPLFSWRVNEEEINAIFEDCYFIRSITVRHEKKSTAERFDQLKIIKKKMVDNMSRSVCVFLTFIYWSLAHPVWPDWKCRLRTVEHWEGRLFSG